MDDIAQLSVLSVLVLGCHLEDLIAGGCILCNDHLEAGLGKVGGAAASIGFRAHPAGISRSSTGKTGLDRTSLVGASPAGPDPIGAGVSPGDRGMLASLTFSSPLCANAFFGCPDIGSITPWMNVPI